MCTISASILAAQMQACLSDAALRHQAPASSLIYEQPAKPLLLRTSRGHSKAPPSCLHANQFEQAYLHVICCRALYT